MNTPVPSHPGSNWRLLGELVLSAGSGTDVLLQTWLTETLGPLALHEELLHRVLFSAQDAAAHAFLKEAAMEYDHIHLVIYGPPDLGARTGTWGFFRVARLESMGERRDASAHSIELYLYLEGQEDKH